ncbi:MAG: hypothetical protein LBV15_02105, partial [Planctomycetota bacterium]|nr:hypothetical protein [Planctomycetota bacterium]
MANQGKEGEKRPDPGSGAAGSREYASFSGASRQTGMHSRASSSSRLKNRRLSRSLAARTTAWVAIILAVSGPFLLLLAQGRVDDFRRSEFRREAASAALAAAVVGRLLLESRGRFLREYPEYVAASEWKTAEHWLVKNRLIEAAKMAEATGFGLEELAPIDNLDGAAGQILFANLRFWSGVKPNFAAVAVFNPDGSLFAAAAGRNFAPSPRLLAPPAQPDEKLISGPYSFSFHLIPDLAANPILVCATDIMSEDRPETRIGSALAAFLVPGSDDRVWSLAAAVAIMI